MSVEAWMILVAALAVAVMVSAEAARRTFAIKFRERIVVFLLSMIVCVTVIAWIIVVVWFLAGELAWLLGL